MDKKVGTRNLFNLALGAFVSWRTREIPGGFEKGDP
jgi:hypothetical protein